ncbi:MAG: succinate dehydrogenase, cytochrome b556 subunit [Wenzhouxiangella sp.]|jgi:succinate dehydrogenase / fumarate reductase cytochrome b subunit|nr:succinate dehydrogenase, cytochrome b556 subunit [Wenzhouxiangella sp.]
MVTDNRPLSPHLQVYRPQLTSVLSISHRITGIILSLGSVVIVAWLLALASGPEAYERVTSVLSSPVALAAVAVWTLALMYHLLNGIRHLFWDAGWLLDLRGAYASGWAVVVLAVALTGLIWGAAL